MDYVKFVEYTVWISVLALDRCILHLKFCTILVLRAFKTVFCKGPIYTRT